ncbi:MAG: FliM/FliN family flagellar motor switch protein [Mixta sp.]
MTLALPRLKTDDARLRQRIGAGQRFDYRLAGEACQLALFLLPAGSQPQVNSPDLASATGDQPAMKVTGFSSAAGDRTLALRCDSGIVQLSDAEGVLGLLSDCPALPHVETEVTPWYWPLFYQGMSEELQRLFGELTPVNMLNHASFALRLELMAGELHLQSTLTASIATLNALLDKPGWRPAAAALPSGLPLCFPLSLGALTLSAAQLRQLRPEDVLLPTRGAFSPRGEGTLQLAGMRLTGELTGEADRAFFTLFDLEIAPVTFPYDNDDMASAPPPDERQQSESAPALDGLPLALTVRCGQLRLTLGELQRLSAGSTVMVDNVQPGEALLCHGDFPLAKGELVDVEGRLGLQITHMLPGSINPLGHDR